MDTLTASLIGAGILAVPVVGFLIANRGKGKFSIKTKFGEVKAEGENPPPPSAVPGGVRIKDAVAGRNLTAHSTDEGGVDLEKVKAEGDIKATHTPGGSPPKA